MTDGLSCAKANLDFWENRHVLITGGAGFVGGWLTKKLLTLKANTVVLDLRTNSPILASLVKKPKLIKGDINNQSLVKEVLAREEIDTIFHLAAQVEVGVANNNPFPTLETNIKGTYNVLEAVRQTKTVSRLIFSSSDKAYGSQKKLPYTEEMPLNGINPYDASKAYGDWLCQMYFQMFSVPVSITRCGNIYGAGDLHFSRLIPGTIRSAFFNKNPIIRSNGKYLRDYVYVEDIVNGHLLLAQAMKKKEILGQAFNFSTGKPYSVLEVVRKILALMGKENLKPQILNKAVGEIEKQSLCLEKAEKMLGWRPAVPFDEGLVKTIEWYDRYFRRLRIKNSE